jgi:hypothetical protein
LVKIGAKVVSHGRYLIFQMAEVTVPRELFGRILERIIRLRPPDHHGRFEFSNEVGGFPILEPACGTRRE